LTIKQALQLHPDAELLLGHALRKPKEFLYMQPEKKLTKLQEKKIKSYLARRVKNEPLAYILGYKYFYGLKFKVTKETLTPRPETEWVIEHIIKNDSAPKSILDVGTGSGCIAISLKKHLSKSKITAVDVSKKALAIAQQNAHANKVQVNFQKSDLLSNLKNASFEIIIANLPYGWKGFSKDKSLNYEPAQALYTKDKGLFLYKKLLRQASQLTTPPHKIYMEIDPRQKIALRAFIKKIIPKAQTNYYRDLSKKWRYVEIDLQKVVRSARANLTPSYRSLKPNPLWRKYLTISSNTPQ